VVIRGLSSIHWLGTFADFEFSGLRDQPANSAKFDALSYAFAAARFNWVRSRIDAANGNLIDRELLPAFLKDWSNG
jgi:hypothetical protein